MNDLDGVRVPASDVVRLMNQAQRIIYIHRPDSTAAVSPFALVAGPKQALPSNAVSLINIPANVIGARRRITKVDKGVLDDYEPDWQGGTPASVIDHFIYDPRTPRVFWVYPPAVPGTLVEMVASSYLDDLPATTGDGQSWNTAVGNIGLADEFESALIALTLHLVYRSDLEGVLNLNLSEQYLRQAGDLLGVQLTSSAVVAPKTE